ncbi:hypothetical protein EON65_01880 [archaeon]|nr:MAG: hypothetical protein EON65_01880 [archaeon]
MSVLTLGIIRVESFFGFKKLGILNSPLHSSIDLQPQYNFSLVLKNGIIDYIGETNIDDLVVNFYNESFNFKPTTRWQLVRTRFNLWKQLPWRKIKGKIILKASVSGSLSVTPSKLPGLFSSVSPSYAEQVSSLHDLMNLFVYAAHDPRVQAIYLGKGYLHVLPVFPVFSANYPITRTGSADLWLCQAG